MSDLTSKPLYLVNQNPGVFYTDDPGTNPDPERLRGYDPNQLVGNITQSMGQSIKETKSHFMLGTWNATGSDLDSTDHAWHMYHGQRQSHDLKAPNKKWNAWYGWGNLFSSVTHSPYRGSGDNIANFPSLELYTQRQMTESQGLLIGSRSIGEARECTARWMSPIGIQFKWHNWFTKGNASGMKLWNFFLMYTDNWAPSRPLYAPIVQHGKPTSGLTYTGGNNILSDDGKELGGEQGGRAGGEFVGFVDPNSMDIIRDKYTTSACLGLYIDMRITKYDGAVYDKVFDFWDFKLLFETRDIGSKIIYPEPHNLGERMDTGKVKLL